MQRVVAGAAEKTVLEVEGCCDVLGVYGADDLGAAQALELVSQVQDLGAPLATMVANSVETNPPGEPSARMISNCLELVGTCRRQKAVEYLQYLEPGHASVERQVLAV